MGQANTSWFRQITEAFFLKLERNILSNKSLKCKVVYGPVRSRRLGYVIGINNIKPKVCSYNCIYCPSGKTSCCSICTNYCLSPYELHLSVKNKLKELKENHKKIDYIVFAGSGAPTLDSSLSKEILLLREFGYKIAVFTNSSLVWGDNIQEELMFADYVSLKIDTVNEATWQKLNRPHRRLDYDLILDGISEFAKRFKGTLTTETMLIKGFNDNESEIDELSKFLNKLNHSASYFMTPMYPSAENFAVSPDDETLKQLAVIIKEKVANSVLLCCSETEEFFATNDFENELLGLLSIHPVSKEAIDNYTKNPSDIDKLENLLKNNLVEILNHNGKEFFALSAKARLAESPFTNN